MVNKAGKVPYINKHNAFLDSSLYVDVRIENGYSNKDILGGKNVITA